jgi:hypothetical protein
MQASGFFIVLKETHFSALTILFSPYPPVNLIFYFSNKVQFILLNDIFFEKAMLSRYLTFISLSADQIREICISCFDRVA